MHHFKVQQQLQQLNPDRNSHFTSFFIMFVLSCIHYLDQTQVFTSTVPATILRHFTLKASDTSVHAEANAHSADWLMRISVNELAPPHARSQPGNCVQQCQRILAYTINLPNELTNCKLLTKPSTKTLFNYKISNAVHYHHFHGWRADLLSKTCSIWKYQTPLCTVYMDVVRL